MKTFATHEDMNPEVDNFIYRPDPGRIMSVAHFFQKKHGVKPAYQDRNRTLLLLIDEQRDFCHPEGSLFVAGKTGNGAVEDNARLVHFMQRELSNITSIAATLDTHLPFQIFTPSFWQDQYGRSLLPHDIINEHMQVVRQGVVTDLTPRAHPPLGYEMLDGTVEPKWVQKHVEYYCKELVSRNKPPLYIWPEHCQLGTMGHGLVGAVQEQMLFHAYARSTNYILHVKGNNPLTECYSVFGPEVMETFDNSGPIDEKDIKFLTYVTSFDQVVIAGQAFSHCVRSSIDDLIEYVKKARPALLPNIGVLTDCMSPVVVPNVVDYTELCEASAKRWEGEGVRLVRSTQPLDSWDPF